jgi:hypothetical protein
MEDQLQQLQSNMGQITESSSAITSGQSVNGSMEFKLSLAE